MLNNKSTLPAWWQIGIALLPGLFAFGNSWVVDTNAFIPFAVIVLCLLIGLTGIVYERQIPVWTLPILGILFGLFLRLSWLPVTMLLFVIALAVSIWLRRGRFALSWPAMLVVCLIMAIDFLRPWLYPGSSFRSWDTVARVVFMGSPILASLFLARNHGIGATLFVLGAAWQTVMIDLTYGLWKTPWGIVMVALLALSLLLISPYWVLQARSTAWKIVGVLLPTFTVLLSVVILNAIARTDPAILNSVVNLYALVPATAQPWIAVGVEGREQLLPLLLHSGVTAVQLFLSVTLAVLLFKHTNFVGGSTMPLIATASSPQPHASPA
jgi:hypothetical protein